MNTLSALQVDPAFALSFRVREPAPLAPTALLVLLHGVGGNETNLADLAARIDADTLVVLPRGPLELGVDQYAWFRVAFTAAGPQIVASEAETSRRTLIGFIGQLQAVHGIASRRTAIAGFSQGGILSASVALSAPEGVRAFAVLAGRILPELEPAIAARERLAGLAGWIAHGVDDTKLPVSWATQADAWLTRLGVAHDLRLYPGGHGIGDAMARDFVAWVDALLASGGEPARLRFEDGGTWLVGGPSGPDGLQIAPGIDLLLRDHFMPPASRAAAMEAAIAAIEDELARVPASVHGTAIASADPWLHAIAHAAGLDRHATALHREAVEQVFARLSAVAMGRPAMAEGLPEDPRFAAALLVVRELMHHLQIESIRITPVSADVARVPEDAESEMPTSSASTS
jgi:phospholipase/carboxylesterase